MASARPDLDAALAVDDATRFAEESPFPAPETLYDNVYVLPETPGGWYSAEDSQARRERAQSASWAPRGPIIRRN